MFLLNPQRSPCVLMMMINWWWNILNLSVIIRTEVSPALCLVGFIGVSMWEKRSDLTDGCSLTAEQMWRDPPVRTSVMSHRLNVHQCHAAVSRRRSNCDHLFSLHGPSEKDFLLWRRVLWTVGGGRSVFAGRWGHMTCRSPSQLFILSEDRGVSMTLNQNNIPIFLMDSVTVILWVRLCCHCVFEFSTETIEEQMKSDFTAIFLFCSSVQRGF